MFTLLGNWFCLDFSDVFDNDSNDDDEIGIEGKNNPDLSSMETLSVSTGNFLNSMQPCEIMLLSLCHSTIFIALSTNEFLFAFNFQRFIEIEGQIYCCEKGTYSPVW